MEKWIFQNILLKECLKIHENNELYVLEENSEILGFFTLKLIDDEIANFSMLTVLEKHQKKGYGNRILNYIIEQSKKKRLTKNIARVTMPKKLGTPSKRVFERLVFKKRI